MLMSPCCMCHYVYVCAVREPEQREEVPTKPCVTAELRAGRRPQDHSSPGEHQREHAATYWTPSHTAIHSRHKQDGKHLTKNIIVMV